MKKKILCLLLGVVLCLSSLIGCGSDAEGDSKVSESAGSEASQDKQQSEASADISNEEIVDLKMLLIGDAPKGNDETIAALNEKLAEKLGVTLTVEYWSYSDFSEKYPLMLSGDNQYDITFMGFWTNYVKYAQMGGFYELSEEFMQKNAPVLYEKMPSIVWDQAKVNDKVYMVGSYKVSYNNGMIMLRGDLRKEVGMDKIQTEEDLMEYFRRVKETHPDMYLLPDEEFPDYYYGTSYSGKGYVTFDSGAFGTIGMDVTDETSTIYSPVYTDGYLEYAYKCRKLVENGIIPADVAANDSLSNMFENGLAAAYWNNHETILTNYNNWSVQHPEWELEIYDYDDAPKYQMPFIRNGYAIPAKAANPEKAIQLIELIVTDQEYYDLVRYGVEGEDYEWVDDETIRRLPDADGDFYSFGCDWGFINNDMERKLEENPDWYYEIMNEWEGQSVANIAFYLNISTEEIESEMATISALQEEYHNALRAGMIETSEIEAYIEEYRQKLETAGIQTVIDYYNNAIQEALK